VCNQQNVAKQWPYHNVSAATAAYSKHIAWLLSRVLRVCDCFKLSSLWFPLARPTWLTCCLLHSADVEVCAWFWALSVVFWTSVSRRHPGIYSQIRIAYNHNLRNVLRPLAQKSNYNLSIFAGCLWRHDLRRDSGKLSWRICSTRPG